MVRTRSRLRKVPTGETFLRSGIKCTGKARTFDAKLCFAIGMRAAAREF